MRSILPFFLTLLISLWAGISSSARCVFPNGDGADRLIAIETKPGAIAAGVKAVKLVFRYDYLNRRFSKLIYTHNGSIFSAQPEKVVLYYWNGWNLLAEATYTTTWNGTSLQSAAFAAGNKYYWGLDWSGSGQGAGGVGGLIGISRKEGAAAAQPPVFPAFDANGNPVTLFDASGQSIAQYEYSPFGQTIRATGAWAKKNPFRFATKLLDSETGLLYHNARYYSPDLGRFLSQDPIGESGGANLYAFVNNNSAGGIDVLGYATYFSSLSSGKLSNSTGGFTTFDSGVFSSSLQSLSRAYDSVFPKSSISRSVGQYTSHTFPSGNGLRNLSIADFTNHSSFGNSLWEPYRSRGQKDPLFGNPLRSYSNKGFVISDHSHDASFRLWESSASSYDFTALAESGKYQGKELKMLSAFSQSKSEATHDLKILFGVGEGALLAAAFLEPTPLGESLLLARTGARGAAAGMRSVAPTVEQYALRAADSGFYPVMTRGSKAATEITWLEKGNVWKFGTTKNPGTRYSQSYLDNIGDHGILYRTEWQGTAAEALQLERMKIMNFQGQTGGVLPAGNKIVR